MVELKEITYKEERLGFFADQRKTVQKRYDRLEKAIKPDEPYLSERRQFLSDLGRELSFYNDVIKMLEADIPQKVSISLKGTTDWNTRCRCPACRKDLFDGQKYCSECGQRIDWGN